MISKLVSFYLQVSKSLELAGIKTAGDFKNVQETTGVEHGSSAPMDRSGQGGGEGRHLDDHQVCLPRHMEEKQCGGLANSMASEIRLDPDLGSATC